MDERIYELDSQGDVTFVIYDVPKSQTQTLDQLHARMLDGSKTESTSPPEEDVNPQTVKIRASSKHLTLSSPQFARELRSGFQESHDVQKTGHLELKIESWDPENWNLSVFMVLLMLILHGRTRAVPRDMTIRKLADFAMLVDYYECYEAVEVFTDMWIGGLRRWTPTSVKKAEEALFMSWVFQHRQMFAKAGGYLQRNLTGQGLMQLAAIDRAREDAIGMILDRLHDRVALLRSDNVQCSYECDCVLLGALTRHMHRLGILERPAPPFEGIRTEQLAKEAPSVLVPRWYQRGGEIEHSCTATQDFHASLRCSEDALRIVDLEEVTELRK